MATFILTWRPAQWTWTDLAECCAAMESGQEIAVEWSTGRRQTMVIGDNVYFMRQLSDPIGLFGHGIILTKPGLRERWDDKTKDEYRVEVRVKSLLDPTVMAPMDMTQLKTPLDALWKAKETGERVHPNGSGTLRDLWRAHWEARQPHGLIVPAVAAPQSRKKLLRVL